MLSTYIPGFTNMLMQPEYIGGPARVNLPAAPAPAPSVRPSAPPIMAAPAVAPTAAPVSPAIDPAAAPALANLFQSLPDLSGINRTFIGTGLGGSPTQQLVDLGIDPATGLTLSKARTVELGPMGTIVREITPEGSVPGAYFSNDLGMPATTGLGKGSSFTPLDPNAVYTVVNERTGEVVSTGTGAEGLKAAQLASSKLSSAGRKADWAVVKTDPATGKDSIVANVDPRQSPLGKFADVVLPAALGFAVPGLGLVGSKVLGAGLGAAAGSALSSVAQGRSLEETLKRAAISGGAAGLGSAVGGKLAGALSNVGGQTTGQIAGQTISQAAAPVAGILVERSLPAIAGAALGTAAGAGLSSTLSNMAPGKGADFADRVFQQPTTPAVQVPSPLDAATGGIDVVASRIPTAVNPLPIATAGAGALAQAGYDTLPGSVKQQIEQKQAEQEPEREIVVSGKPPPAQPTISPQDALAVLGGSTAGNVFNDPFGNNQIIAEQTRPVGEPSRVAPVVTAPAGNVFNDPLGGNQIIAEGTPPPKEPLPIGALIPGSIAPTLPDLTKTPVDVQGPEKSILDKLKENLSVTDYLRLAGLGVGLLSGGGGGRGALGTIPSGLFGGGSGVFGGSLPRPTLPGASTGFAPRTADDLGPKTTQDWYRYGYGPEQSFFSYVPEGAANTSQAYTGYEQEEPKGMYLGGMAGGGEMRDVGGSSFAVNGPGTGRSDEIPAMLSDGEYVIDAETVALLGDGSSKAGADRLDEFRANVRKHKGRHLAKGDFSVNAKRPEKYLKGGRT